ncbi:M23 family metallopeptidase [Roseibium suaedae]|uniref:Murein DD-endopeptidase MepM and murein hydrolase activator NlpD, contain LysM domain n=1 Tax=Roseibium suaedae TaxID=735517 RepID=A0A1M7L0V3_9HYPH|nr:M23 family metallopeptidase [Roseibium suaedae]SHM71487.1 Murein DD-endopeptidase MepM and murein hydrolase activator NlpD, contain LysM domain [Roseibium suaedae]
MSKRLRIPRGDLVSRIALMSLTAGLLAGCSSAVERFSDYDFTTSSVSNRPAASSQPSQPSYRDVASGSQNYGYNGQLPSAGGRTGTTGSVTRSADGAPLPHASVPSGGGAYAQAPASMPSRSAVTSNSLPPVETAPAPEMRTASLREPVASAPVSSTNAASWNGWSSAGGTRVTLRNGDTVAGLSKRYGVPERAIVAVNGIEDVSSVRPGQSLIIPTYAYSPNGGSSRADSGSVVRPVAQAADTMTTGSIPSASAAGVNAKPTAKPRHQPQFAEVRSGTATDASPIRASAPGAKPTRSTATAPARTVSVSGSVPESQNKPALISSASEPVRQETAPAKIEKPQVVANADPVETGVPNFRWPVRGKVISEFGAKPGGARNDGVNLSVPEGTPVKAADSGTVIYAGNELKGYGNLVLLRHEDGWVTAYAHNSELSVKRGDAVNRGDTIALAGATGSVNQPQVHFEVRKGNKPVDPARYLPKD